MGKWWLKYFFNTKKDLMYIVVCMGMALVGVFDGVMISIFNTPVPILTTAILYHFWMAGYHLVCSSAEYIFKRGNKP